MDKITLKSGQDFIKSGQDFIKSEQDYIESLTFLFSHEIRRQVIFKSENNWVLFTVIRKLLEGFYLFY